VARAFLELLGVSPRLLGLAAIGGVLALCGSTIAGSSSLVPWDAQGSQRCIRCGAGSEARAWGPITIRDDFRPAEASRSCLWHEWEWTGCVETRWGILCFW
jgi:hypothetical protein